MRKRDKHAEDQRIDRLATGTDDIGCSNRLAMAWRRRVCRAGPKAGNYKKQDLAHGPPGRSQGRAANGQKALSLGLTQPRCTNWPGQARPGRLAAWTSRLSQGPADLYRSCTFAATLHTRGPTGADGAAAVAIAPGFAQPFQATAKRCCAAVSRAKPPAPQGSWRRARRCHGHVSVTGRERMLAFVRLEPVAS